MTKCKCVWEDKIFPGPACTAHVNALLLTPGGLVWLVERCCRVHSLSRWTLKWAVKYLSNHDWILTHTFWYWPISSEYSNTQIEHRAVNTVHHAKIIDVEIWRGPLTSSQGCWGAYPNSKARSGYGFVQLASWFHPGAPPVAGQDWHRAWRWGLSGRRSWSWRRSSSAPASSRWLRQRCWLGSQSVSCRTSWAKEH